jgi:hypothetical protein
LPARLSCWFSIRIAALVGVSQLHHSQGIVPEALRQRTMTGPANDLCYVLRQLRRSPTFTTAAVVTLIFGIGAHLFGIGILNALLLKPLDVPEPGKL